MSDFATSREEARNAATGEIELVSCLRCGFIWNRSFEVGKIAFEPGYQASLIHSGIFRSYIEGLSSRLIDRYSLREKSILEIGCGAGEFLRLLCEKGGNAGVGIDPTIRVPGFEKLNQGSVELIRDYFDHKHAVRISDFVCCLSVFEDIHRPLEFLKSLRAMIGNRSEVTLYFEVPNVSHMLRERSTWNLYYEQCNHFSQNTLELVFRLAGFEVLEAGESYQNGQYVFVEARPSASSLEIPANESTSDEQLDSRRTFSRDYHSRLYEWQDRLTALKKVGKKIAVWGSGGKGVGFLNALDCENTVDFVVDINPERWGRFIPGSAQEIVAPESLKKRNPDVIIISNPLYKSEIQAEIARLSVNAELLELR